MERAYLSCIHAQSRCVTPVHTAVFYHADPPHVNTARVSSICHDGTLGFSNTIIGLTDKNN